MLRRPRTVLFLGALAVVAVTGALLFLLRDRGTYVVLVLAGTTEAVVLEDVTLTGNDRTIRLRCRTAKDDTSWTTCTRRMRATEFSAVTLSWTATTSAHTFWDTTELPVATRTVADRTTVLVLRIDQERSHVRLADGSVGIFPFVEVEHREGAAVLGIRVSGGSVVHAASYGTDRFGGMRQNFREAEGSLQLRDGRPVLPEATIEPTPEPEEPVRAPEESAPPEGTEVPDADGIEENEAVDEPEDESV